MQIFENFLNRQNEETKERKQEVLNKIEVAKKRLLAKDAAIKELEYERELLFNALCFSINNDLKRSDFNIFRGFNSDIFLKAWKWHNKQEELKEDFFKNNKMTEAEYEDFKISFDITTKKIKEIFFKDLKDEVTLEDIIMSWSIGYDFSYKYKDQKIIVFIPNFTADKDSFEYILAGYGYRVNYQESEYCQSYICIGLDAEECAQKLHDWLTTEGWKKDTKK